MFSPSYCSILRHGTLQNFLECCTLYSLRLACPFKRPNSTKLRSEFDHMLMNHARSSGASVYEQTKVTGISFSNTDPRKPISVAWIHTPSNILPSPPASPQIDTAPRQSISGTTTFDYLVDATGRAGIISTKYIKDRHFNESLKNIAVWGYWKNVGTYGVGTGREGAPWFEALTGKLILCGCIPLY
jgi:flavin-dependent dehydrogenase